MPFFWIRFFDRVTSRTANSDAANGVFFLGRKSQVAMAPKEIVQYYWEMREAPAKRAARGANAPAAGMVSNPGMTGAE